MLVAIPFLPAHAAALALSLALAPSPGPPVTGAEAPIAPDSLTATIQAVHADQGEVAVVTGVSLALKVVHFQVVATTRLEREDEAASLAQMEPGDVVRIHYHQVNGRNVADSVVVVMTAEGGGR